MPLSQTGANYQNQAELQHRDRMLGAALDDIASQMQAVRAQGGFGQSGAPAPPHPVTAISVSSAGGFATVNLIHNGAPPGSQYVIEYSTTPNFQNPNPVRVDNGISLSFHQYLKGQTVYFRTAARLSASALSGWTYYGSSTTPTPVTF